MDLLKIGYRKLVVITFLTSTPLLLSFQSQSAQAADMVGAICSKVGSKSVVGKTTLSCIKTGDKLVWTKLTDPTPTPSPTFTCPDGSCGNPNISVPLNPTKISEFKKEIEALQKEIKALKTKYGQSKELKEKKSINNRIAELTKKVEGLNKVLVDGESENASSKKPKPTPTPTRTKNPWEYFIGGEAIKNEIEGLQAKYNQSKDAKEKESISNMITELKKKLERLNSTPAQGKPKTEQAPTTGVKQYDIDREEGLIKKEIEGLQTKYNQSKDAKEKESINNRINELMIQLEKAKTKIVLSGQSDQ